MNPYDVLLTWVSERRAGSVGLLRSACDWTSRLVPDKPGLELAADLEALGHIDVREGRWTVVPTVLSRLADGGGNSLMIGSRPGWVVDAFDDLDGNDSPGIRALADHVYENLKVPQAGPSTWFLAAGPEAPFSEFNALGVQVFDDVAGAQLRRTMERGVERKFREVRPGELIGKLDPAALVEGRVDWLAVASDRSAGFYRYLRNNQRIYAQRSTDGWFEIDYRWAICLAQPHTPRAAWFVPRDRCLYLRGVTRPPLEIERALVLRTGRLAISLPAPGVTGSAEPVRAYINVTSQIAGQVADLLGKELIFR